MKKNRNALRSFFLGFYITYNVGNKYSQRNKIEKLRHAVYE